MASTMTDALLSNIDRVAAGEGAYISNIIKGGQSGIGTHIRNIDAVTPLVLTPAIVVVTHAPTLFDRVGDGRTATEILKALVERHAKSITGIDFGYTLDSAPTAFGHDGQEMNIPTNAKRTAVNPTFVWPEIQGNLVWNFIRMWIKLMRDPDITASNLASVIFDEWDPMLYSAFTMDICVIQYDPTFRPENILAGYFITTMYPTETGTIGVQRELGVTNVQERSVPFMGIVQDNYKTFEAAKAIANVLNLHRADYDNMPSVADAVEDSLSNFGISQEIEEIASEVNNG